MYRSEHLYPILTVNKLTTAPNTRRGSLPGHAGPQYTAWRAAVRFLQQLQSQVNSHYVPNEYSDGLTML